MSADNWPSVGQDAAVVFSGWSSRIGRTRMIAKIGKRDIVLDDGTRWSVEHLHRSGERYSRERLIDPTSKEADELRRAARFDEVTAEARKAVDQFNRERTSANAQNAIDSLRKFIAEDGAK